MVRGFLGLCLVLVLLLWGGEAQAGPLADRLAQFPNWDSKPPVSAAKGDLVYPDWLEGTWKVTNTLVEQVAPLAPKVVSPGFEGNRRYLNQPLDFLVRFKAVTPQPSSIADSILHVLPLKLQNWGSSPLSLSHETPIVVADRAFNALNITKAYLSDRTIQSVKVDPKSPNRQITFLNTGLQLISIVTGRASETPTPDRFISTEVTNQFFRGTLRPYFNQVETTTAYQLKRLPTLAIDADQVTAIYLSPQDADYFKALDRPVALYRYRLELQPVESTKTSSAAG
jgi:hypothetical protein